MKFREKKMTVRQRKNTVINVLHYMRWYKII